MPFQGQESKSKPRAEQVRVHPGKQNVVTNPPPQPSQLGTDSFTTKQHKANVDA